MSAKLSFFTTFTREIIQDKAMSKNEIKSTIRNYLTEELYFEFDSDPNDSDLFESGNIDSLGFITWIGFLEETYNIKFSPTDIRPENFRTINVITDFLIARFEDKLSS
jgi:acyl carrier protein